MIQINSNSSWWRKVFITTIGYVLFWLVFYGLPFLIPDDFFEVHNITGLLTIFYILVIVPWLSFFMFKLFKNKFLFNKNYFLILHIFYLLCSTALFFSFLIVGALRNFGGF